MGNPLTARRYSGGPRRRPAVTRVAETIELAAEDLRRQRDLDGLVQKAHPDVVQIQIVGALEDQDQHLVVRGSDDLTIACLVVAGGQPNAVAKGDAGGVADHDQAATGLGDVSVFFDAHGGRFEFRVASCEIWVSTAMGALAVRRAERQGPGAKQAQSCAQLALGPRPSALGPVTAMHRLRNAGPCPCRRGHRLASYSTLCFSYSSRISSNAACTSFAKARMLST